MRPVAAVRMVLPVLFFFTVFQAGTAAAQWTDVPHWPAGWSVPDDMNGIVSDGAGGAIVVWSGNKRSTDQGHIYAQHLGYDGTYLWPDTGVVICEAPGGQGGPRVVGDGSGGWLVVWGDYRTSGPKGLYAQHLNSAGTPTWPADGVWVSAYANAGNGELISDGSGGAVAAWMDFSSAGYGHIYAQRIYSDGSTWPGEVVVCKLNPSETGPDVVSDGQGGWIVVWRDGRNGTPPWYIEQDVYAQRLSATGVAQWQEDGVPICSSHHTGSWGVIPVEAGHVLAWWRDDRSGHPQTFAQRFGLGLNGTPEWAQDGQLLPIAPDSAWGVMAAPDDSGGAFLVWNDGPDYGQGNNQVRSQRVDASNTPLWPGNGIVLGDYPSDSDIPRITARTGGGAIVAWGNGGIGLRAQKVRSDGSWGWGVNAIHR